MAQATTLKDLAERRSDIFYVDPQKLVMREGWNARVDSDPDNIAHIESLALSIGEVGVKEPLTVFRDPDTGEIVVSDGHCRLKATLLAIKNGHPILMVPVKTEGRDASEADRAFSQVIRNAGKPLTLLELGRAYKRQLGYGWTEKQISDAAGRSVSHVKQALTLQAADKETVDLVAKGKVSASLAIKTGRGKSPKAAAAALKAGVERAEQAGKAKATAKDVDTPKTAEPDKAKQLETLKTEFRDAHVRHDEDWVVVTFAAKAFDRVVAPILGYEEFARADA